MRFDSITKDNVDFFAIKNYKNPHSRSEKDFNEDMRRFRYIKRLLNKYHTTGQLKERLILNHMIILNNVFGTEAAAILLLFKVNKEYWSELKSFMLYLNMITDKEVEQAQADNTILKRLQDL